MTTDVEFRLTLTRDPQSRSTLRQWEADLIASINRVEALRVRNGMASINTLHRAQTNSLNAQSQQYTANLQRQQTALRQALANQQTMWTAYVNNVNRMLRGLGGGGGGAVPGGGAGGGGGAVPGGGGAAGSTNMLSALGLAGAARRFAPAAVAYGGYRLATQSVQDYADIESQQIQLQVLTGSKGAAKDLIAELRRVSSAFGVTLTELAAASKLMIGFGVDADDSADKLKRFAAITGGNTDAMYRLGRAYGQVKGLGKLMAEETNQMIDAGFSPLIAIAERTGEKIGQVRERMKDGAVSFDEVREAIERVTDAGGKFAGVMEAMEKSTTAKIGRMKQSWLDFKQSLGKFLVGDAASPLSKPLESSPALIGTGAYVLDPTYERFQSLELARGEALAKKGYTSSNVARIRLTIPSLAGLVVGSMGGNNHAVKAYELEVALAAKAKERADAQKKIAAERLKEKQAIEENRTALFKNQAAELVQAKAIGDIRIKNAQAELKIRKDILDDAKKATAEAVKSLMSAQERFGAMSTEDQQAAISDLMLARRNGVRGLSLEQIGRIQSIGTKEAKDIAGAAYRNRASGAFGVSTSALESTAARDIAIRQEIAQLESSRPRSLSNGGMTKQTLIDRRIKELRYEQMQLRGEAERARSQFQDSVGVRNSLFAQERADVAVAQRRQMVVEAGVKQTIEFIAKFENTAAQVANQVMELYNVASQEQMKEIVKLLTPIKKQVEVMQNRRRAATQN